MDQSNSFWIEGVIQEIFDTQQVSDKFKKREFVLNYTSVGGFNQRSELIKFQLTQENCIILDKFNNSERIKVNFSLRGRDWINPKGEKVFFNTLEVLDIQPLDKSRSTIESPISSPSEGKGIDDTIEDDLPF